MEEKCCKTCEWFDSYWDDGDPPPYTGDCHRHPPVWVGDSSETEYSSETSFWAVPHVGAYSRCGEWTRKEEQ